MAEVDKKAPKTLEAALDAFEADLMKRMVRYQADIDAKKKDLDEAQAMERTARAEFSSAVAVKMNASFAADAARAEIVRTYDQPKKAA